MQVKRHYTREGVSPYADITFKTVSSELRRPDGQIMSRVDDFQVPEAWSQVASDILARKYFRKAGVPVETQADNDIVKIYPWLPDGNPLKLNKMMVSFR